MTPFHCTALPEMSMSDYLERFPCSPQCFVVCGIYIDRVLRRHPQLRLSALSRHRLAAVALVISIKFTDDVFYSNTFYAKCAGLSLQELNALEGRLLRLLDYRLFVSKSDYCDYEVRLRKYLSALSP